MVESIGQQLRQRREARSLTLAEAARATHIRVYYLEAFEAGDYQVIPSLAQGKGFLRAYANYLGVDPQPFIAELETELGLAASDPADSPMPAAAAIQPGRQEAQASKSPVPQPDTRLAESIFKEIGLKLRSQREMLGLSLQDIERHTHLRTHYLARLEAGELSGLPSPVQGRGMLNNYATFLGLDPEPIMLRFAEGLQAQLVARQAVERKPIQPRKPLSMAGRLRTGKPGNGSELAEATPSEAVGQPPSVTRSSRATPRHLTLRRFFTLDILVAVLVILSMAAFVVWGGLRIINLRTVAISRTPTLTAPSIADVLSTNSASTPTPLSAALTQTVSDTLVEPVQTLALPTLAQPSLDASQTVTVTNQSGTPQVTRAATATPSGPIQVNLVIQQRAWMRVLVDGKVEFDGIALPGSAYPFSGDKIVEVLTGNGAAIQVIYNQTDMGPLGDYGVVVDRLYTLSGVLTPTASTTPTLQRTPTPLPGGLLPTATTSSKATQTLTPVSRPSATATP